MKQLTMFEYPKFNIKNPIRLIELFGGIGCQASALERLGIEFEHYRMCDSDKYAVRSYNAIHGTNFVPSDITKITAEDLGIVETNKYDYIMTYSFPCTDLSIAGKCAGMSRDSGTRSGLLWEVERLLKECNELPRILLMENVPQVHGKGNIDNFNEWCMFLESKGYKNYWKDLNAKNYGIPQNRNRTFMVSLLGDYCYEFPKSIELKLRLKDMLEDEVDEKYYLSDKIFKHNIKNISNENSVFTTLGTNCGSSTSSGGGVVKTNLCIRKLTPKECWRLIGLSDTDFDKAKAIGISNSQLYKQAGNGIVVNVLMAIFKKLLKGE